MGTAHGSCPALSDSSSLLTPGASPLSYGKSIPWTAIPECWNTSELSCDLTHYTPDPEERYLARVRAVSGNLTSLWKRTNTFSPEEGGLGSTLCCSWRGQGAELLGKKRGMNESRDNFPPHLPGGCAGRWDKPRVGGTVPAQSVLQRLRAGSREQP